MMEVGGYLCSQSVQFEWKFEYLRHMNEILHYGLQSPRFRFCDTLWYLDLHPNGEEDSSEWLSLNLIKDCSLPPYPLVIRPSAFTPLNVTYTFGIKKPDDSVAYFTSTNYFHLSGQGWGTTRFILKSEFLSLLNVTGRDGTLGIFCTMSVDAGRPVQQLPLPESSYSFFPKELEIDMLKRNLSEAQQKIERISTIFNTLDLSMLRNFEELLETSDGDVTLRVGNHEFRGHKLVLAARSSVFRDMFENGLQENIIVLDCEQSTFNDFLQFLYSGKFDIVRPSNALKLFSIADRFNVVQLKKKCMEIMAELSPESV